MSQVNYNTFPAPFTVQPTLTSIAIAYQNERMIADQVMPRVPVSLPDFKWTKFTKEDTFTIPDTKVGRRGKTNQVDWSASEQVSSVDDHALEEAIPQRDIEASQGTMVNPEARATEQVSELLALDREQRVSNLVFNPASYASGQVTTLTGTSQWSDFTNSDPLSVILNTKDSMLVRPNVLVLGRAVATKLRTHPKILTARGGAGAASSSTGYAAIEFLAELLEFDQVLVGEGWLNIAKKGQAANMTRVWGKHAAMLYVNPTTSGTNSLSFGVTAQWGTRLAGRMQDPDIGMRGGVRVRVGESVKEVVLANDLGWLFQNAVA